MPEFNAEQLKKWSGGRWTERPSAPVRGFTYDSRKVKPGDLFVCLKTEIRDGHDFLGSAAEAGAVGALVSQPNRAVSLPQLVVADPLAALGKMAAAHRATFRGPVVGISGSCGKTSTKDLLALLLGGAPSVYATEGNLNNLIGTPVTLLGLDPKVHTTAVIEAGINLPGEMAELVKMIRPTAVIITSISPVHLEQLGDLEGVAREKAILTEKLDGKALTVFPADCLQYSAFREIGGRRIVPGEEAGSEPRFSVQQGSRVTRLQLRDAVGERGYEFRQVSHGLATDAVLAIEMARALGVEDEKIRERLGKWVPTQFRGEFVRVGEIDFYVDCYNANPVAVKDALDFFHDVAEEDQPRIYVLGCMGELGDASAAWHRETGKHLSVRSQDQIFIIGEEAEALREGLLEAGNRAEQVSVFTQLETVEKAIRTYKGYVFLKGSRVYELERLLERIQDRKEAAC